MSINKKFRFRNSIISQFPISEHQAYCSATGRLRFGDVSPPDGLIYCTTMLCSRPWPGESSFTPPPTVYGTTLCCDFWKLELLETGVKDFRMHKVRKREIRMKIIKLPNLRFSEKSPWKIPLFRAFL